MKNVPQRSIDRQLSSDAAALEVAQIRKVLGHRMEKRETRDWLNTGVPELNKIFGSEKFGIPYGKIIEIMGFQSHGKTALTLELMRYAQKDGAICIWLDLENSWDPVWVKTRGADPSQVRVIDSQVGVFGKEREERLPTAEEMCEQVEALIKYQRKKHGESAKIFVGVDSVAALMTEMESSAGLTGQNMRTQLSLPAFMGKLLRRWVGIAQAYNVIFIFINQVRHKPGGFGNPEYSPGGNALPFYASIRVMMRRTKGGRVLNSGKLVGVQGTLTNLKNKAGNSSEEGGKVGFKIYFAKNSKYFPASLLKREEDGKKED